MPRLDLCLLILSTEYLSGVLSIRLSSATIHHHTGRGRAKQAHCGARSILPLTVSVTLLVPRIDAHRLCGARTTAG